MEREILLSLAFALFILCPRMAGMCAVLSEMSGVNPYSIAVVGGLISIPLIALMVYVTIKLGVGYAIALAVATDILSALATGTFRLRYGIEIVLIALFLWMGVIVAGKLAVIIESVFR